MIFRHIRTNSDLVRFAAGLRIGCGDCGASRTLDGFQAGKLAGAVTFTELRRRLRCDRCVGKAAQLAVLPPIERRTDYPRPRCLKRMPCFGGLGKGSEAGHLTLVDSPEVTPGAAVILFTGRE